MKKTLYRNVNDKMIAGVCAGLSDYFGADVAIWRLGAVALTLISGGSFIIIYVVAWIIIPRAPGPADSVREADYTISHE